MNHSEDFIRIYENAIPEQLCDDLIDLFDDMEGRKKLFSRQGTDGIRLHSRSDSYLFLDRSDMSRRVLDGVDYGGEFMNAIEPYLQAYCEEFGLLVDGGALTNEAIKMQKIAPGQGYHVWHWEHGPGPASPRVLVFMLYCNTISNGGETEFLFQKRRISPQKNTLLIWPAGFTHTHRGGLVLGPDSKYIVNGWIRWN